MQQPNIILILTDHFRRDALGRSTPNLTALAREGTRFENAYCAAPLCQPSRNAIITGLYPSQNGICGNQNEPIPPHLRSQTFMRHLQQAGYYTAMIGKHHYIDRYGIGMDVRDDDDAVKAYGFDHVLQVVDDGENMHNDDAYTAWLRERGMLQTFRDACMADAWACRPHPFEADETADGFIGCNGIRFVTEYPDTPAGNANRPFYLNLSFIGPHPPFWHPGELTHDPDAMPAPLGVDDNPRDRRKKAHYMEKCALIDRYVGRLIQALEDTGQRDNTVVIFTADHGENAGDFGIWDKRFFYEQSCGVPLVLAGQGIPGQERLCGNRVSKALVSHLDLYPTILQLAGARPGPDPGRAGRSLLDILADRPGSGRDAVHAQLGTAVMVRTGNWKLVFDPQAGGVQNLYNLAVDPNELTNLAGTAGYQQITATLIQTILEHRIRTTQKTQVKEEQRLQRVHVP